MQGIDSEGMLEVYGLGCSRVDKAQQKGTISTITKIKNKPVTVDVVEDAAAAIAILLSPVRTERRY